MGKGDCPTKRTENPQGLNKGLGLTKGVSTILILNEKVPGCQSLLEKK